jgi:hypothetical protein
MFRSFTAAFLSCALAGFVLAPAMARADSQWVLDQSTLTYQVTHPMHTVDGISHAARGKGNCSSGQCVLLIAVPVKTFDTGDSNRDLHMIETVRGAEFPMILVHAQFPDAEAHEQWIHANVDVQFSGQTAHYTNVPFERTQKGNDVIVTGTLPLTCSDFKIPRPSFLTVPIKNEIPVHVEMSWHEQ